MGSNGELIWPVCNDCAREIMTKPYLFALDELGVTPIRPRVGPPDTSRTYLESKEWGTSRHADKQANPCLLACLLIACI